MAKRKFEVVKGFEDRGVHLPTRSTKNSAGYDFRAIEDVIIPSVWERILNHGMDYYQGWAYFHDIHLYSDNSIEKFSKESGWRPTLVPTGVKCKMEEGEYLALHNRSSLALKYGLILANGVGVIDQDYYSNESNDGHIMFQFINLLPVRVEIKRGERIGQGIFTQFNLTDDDEAKGDRTGGFGSTTE